MKCIYCGKQIPDTAKVCGYCGKQLREQSVRSQNREGASLLRWLGTLLLIGILVPLILFLINGFMTGNWVGIASLFENESTEEICVRMAFLSDVTIPDGSTLQPGEAFDKIWRVQNTGSCSWTPNYQLVFFSGEKMSGMDVSYIGVSVQPGQTTDLIVRLAAPSSPGTYRGYWLLRNESGDMFGFGNEAREPIWVEIQVAALPTATIMPTPGSAQGSIASPAPTRCDLFKNMEITLHWVEPLDGGIVFQLYAKMSENIPGLGERIAGDAKEWEYQFKIGSTYAGNCRVYKEFPNRLYCDYPLSEVYANSFQPLELFVNGCDESIYSNKRFALPAMPSGKTSAGSGGNENPSDGSAAPAACSSGLDPTSCSAAGGTYQYSFCQIPPCPEWCICP